MLRLFDAIRFFCRKSPDISININIAACYWVAMGLAEPLLAHCWRSILEESAALQEPDGKTELVPNLVCHELCLEFKA